MSHLEIAVNAVIKFIILKWPGKLSSLPQNGKNSPKRLQQNDAAEDVVEKNHVVKDAVVKTKLIIGSSLIT